MNKSASLVTLKAKPGQREEVITPAGQAAPPLVTRGAVAGFVRRDPAQAGCSGRLVIAGSAQAGHRCPCRVDDRRPVRVSELVPAQPSAVSKGDHIRCHPYMFTLRMLSTHLKHRRLRCRFGLPRTRGRFVSGHSR